jgi:hypothetical protein
MVLPQPYFNAESEDEEDNALNKHAEHVLPYKVIGKPVRPDRFKTWNYKIHQI